MLTLGLLSLNVMSLMGQPFDSLLTQALKNNPEIKAGMIRLEARAQEISMRYDMPDPMLQLGYFLSPVETRVGSQLLRLNLSQSIPAFGTLKAAGNVSAKLLEADFHELAEIRARLRYELASNYHKLHLLDQQDSIARSRIAQLDFLIELSRSRYEHGKEFLDGLIRLEMLRKEAKEQLRKIEQNRALVQSDLQRITSVESPVNYEYVLPASALISDSFLVMDEQALYSSAPVEFLRTKAAALRAEKELAERKNNPRLQLGLSYTLIGQTEGVGGSAAGTDAFMPTIGLSLPIFRKANQAEIERAALREQEIQELLIDKKNRLAAELKGLQIRLQKKLEDADYYRDLMRDQLKVEELLYERYANGKTEVETLIEQENKTLKYANQLAITQFEIVQLIERIRYVKE